MQVFEIQGGVTNEDVLIELISEEEKKIERVFQTGDLQFLDKNPLEIKVSDQGGVEYPDLISRPIPLISDKLKNIFEQNIANQNIFYKPIYLVDELLEEKRLYWLAIIPQIEFFQDDLKTFNLSSIGNYKVFRDYRKSHAIIYVTEEIKSILERAELERVFFCEI